MSIEIDVLNGNEAWPMAEPLFNAVWPPEVVAKLPWADIVFAHAELRVLVQTEIGEAICHVGIYRREIKWNGRRMQAGGIGAVLTREDKRGKGYATIALSAAIQTLKDKVRPISRCCFANPTTRRFTSIAAGSRSRVRSMPNSRRDAYVSTPSRHTSTI